MNRNEYIASACSSLFRYISLAFLRIIPGPPIWKFALPPLFLAHILTAHDLEQKPASEKKPRTFLRDPLNSILFSLPASRAVKKANVAINVLLLLAVVDFIATPFLDSARSLTFTRVGAVYPDSVKIVVRYPAFNETESYVKIRYRQASATPNVTKSWKDGPTVQLKEAQDWVATTKLSGLWPSTSYECTQLTVTLYSPVSKPVHHSDTLSMPNNTILSASAEPIPFRTFPDPRFSSGTHFRFMASSCITTNFPTSPSTGELSLALIISQTIFPTPPVTPHPLNSCFSSATLYILTSQSASETQ
jgi:alkaline phosphatase D